MTAYARDYHIVDEIERIGGPRVFGDSGRIEIRGACLRVDHDVLQHGSVADGVPDLRLVLGRKPDALGVTTSLEIENARVAPAVLVVADQPALRVGRESRFTGSGE